MVEMNLSRALAVTNTANIRSDIRARIAAEGRPGPPVELMRFHVIVHCTGGNGQHMVDFEDHEMAPGAAIWIRPGQVQRWSHTHNQFDADVLVFESAVVPDLPMFDRLLGTTTVADLGDDAGQLQQQMAWMANDLEENRDHAVGAAVVGVILRMLDRRLRSDSDVIDKAEHRLAAAFVESIDHNIVRRSVAWHSREVGASPRSVARATLEAFGQRPKEVIDARVVLEARRRLAWSDEDIASIARDLQFSEASNFTKFFRTRTGVSPSVFRSNIQALAATSSPQPIAEPVERVRSG